MNAKKRGDVKAYRELLNRMDVGDSKHCHFNYRQRTRKYGDYLYNQDRERFLVEMLEWIQKERPNSL